MTPFGIVYDELWRQAEALEEFQGCVRDGNKMRLTQSSFFKKFVQTSDLPEVILNVAEFRAEIPWTSSSSRVFMTYQWLISTGDFKLENVGTLFPVEWALMKSIARACGPDGIGKLRWNDKPFAKITSDVEGIQGQADPERNRNILGFSAALDLTVEMHFVTRELMAEGF